jgi:hypothetical protein
MFSSQRLYVLIGVVIALDGVALAQNAETGSQGSRKLIAVPKAWNDAGLSDWATPLAQVNIRPGNFTEAAKQGAGL